VDESDKLLEMAASERFNVLYLNHNLTG